MICKNCGSENVVVTTELISGKTRNRGNGLLRWFGRLILIICTCGLWLFVGRSKGTGRTKYKNKTVAICQNCGCKWDV